ncbi:Tubulin-folding cofactor B, partial [Armadillidium nasatum]
NIFYTNIFQMNITISSAPIVNVKVTSNINSFAAEKRFDKSLTIGDLKARLELITGASSGSMILSVYDEKDNEICALNNDSALLGSFPVEENYRIHVVDNSKRVGEFEDLSKVQKFELSEDEYEKKSDTVRNFLLKNKLGKFNEEEQARLQKEKEEAERKEEEKAKTITVGDRCEARVQGEPTRRGEVMFVGKTEFKSGWWVGIKYDEPLGKNDGRVGGKKYFEAPMKYGGFVRPANVEVGDFPRD